MRATSCGPPNATANSNIKLEGVSSISNVQYDDKGKLTKLKQES